LQLRQEKEHFTYADYCTWEDDGQRWELIDGEAYLMASPTFSHQRISRKLARKFDEHLDGKKCEVFQDVDVRLSWNKDDDTIISPDLIITCDPDKFSDDKSHKGAPDLVIEIHSPSTKKYDITTKFIKYREAGVKELWFVDPSSQTVQVFKWEKGEYLAYGYGPTDKITVGTLPELTIDMNGIFDIETSQ